MAKHHNWVTGPNHKVVSRRVNSLARDFISHSGLYTPVVEAELDRLLGLGSLNSEGEPDLEVLGTLEEKPEDDWMFQEPTMEQLEKTEAFLKRLAG